jgi:rare lipoprotein A (peptidoglycan hydrolase)
MGKGKIAVAAFACIAVMAGGTPVAHAQTSGGTPPPGSTTTTTAPTTTTTTTGSWTVYKSATWYGPGFWGEETACGMVLAPTTVGVAHRKLPCGTQVTFNFNGRTTAATVIDRGPFRKGYAWDLTKKTAKQLGFLEVGKGPIMATVTPVYY